ncbi:MAG TPA: ferritin family protein [Candidatus Lokiarchaeia archaeon]|nr:ferritin family protein [Candidatus Lokiarchaeia archaeon]
MAKKPTTPAKPTGGAKPAGASKSAGPSKTLECLARAYLGESQARNRYTFYAKIAADEGFEQIAGIFRETADQEKEHAKKLFGYVQDLKKKEKIAELKIDGVGVPIEFGTTLENLKAAAAGERYEDQIMYPDFAKIAGSEGNKDIATGFSTIKSAEAHHEERYNKLIEVVENETVFKKEEKTVWVCRECGYMTESTEPPAKCPLCGKPHSFYQIKAEEY